MFEIMGELLHPSGCNKTTSSKQIIVKECTINRCNWLVYYDNDEARAAAAAASVVAVRIGSDR